MRLGITFPAKTTRSFQTGKDTINKEFQVDLANIYEDAFLGVSWKRPKLYSRGPEEMLTEICTCYDEGRLLEIRCFPESRCKLMA